jgi:hypothetical protein
MTGGARTAAIRSAADGRVRRKYGERAALRFMLLLRRVLMEKDTTAVEQAGFYGFSYSVICIPHFQ